MPKRRLLYIERLSPGESDASESPDSPGSPGEGAPEPDAWIGRALLSKTGRTVYFNGDALKRLDGRPQVGSHTSLSTGALHWVADPAPDGQDRQGPTSDAAETRGPVLVEEAALEEYLALRGLAELDPATHRVVADLVETDLEALQALEHQRAAQKPGPADAATRRKRRARARRGDAS